MESPTPSHRPHRIVWFALATFGALLLLPATRYLVRTQLQMQTLTSQREPNRDRERAIGLNHPDDYPVQLAIATRLPAGDTPSNSMERVLIRNRNIEALTERFPNNPSVYANFLRFMTTGEMRVGRDNDIYPGLDQTRKAQGVWVYEPSVETRQRFAAAATKGAQLDPDNAYFPMMQSLALFQAHRDTEALEAVKRASRCSHWTEYYQDEAEGLQRLQDLAYGRQGALANLAIEGEILFPQYAQFRLMARVATHLAIQEERAGHINEAITIRHAVMRCGGLMRSQGTSYITALVGIGIANIATSDAPADFVIPTSDLASPGGEGLTLCNVPRVVAKVEEGGPSTLHVYLTSRTETEATTSNADPQSLIYGRSIREETKEHRQTRLTLYDSYLKYVGHPQEAAFAEAEMKAGDEAKAIGKTGMYSSLLDDRSLKSHRMAWLTNWVLLSGTLLMLGFGLAAYVAGTARPRKGLVVWRLLYALLVIGGLGCWQWHAAGAGMQPSTDMANLFAGLSGAGNGGNWQERNALEVQSFAFGLSLLAPALFVGLLAGLSRFQRVPLVTGLGRGLRGAALPVAAVLFLAYGASLIPTVCAEAAIETHTSAVQRNEPHYMAESVQKAWPGDPQP